DGVARVGADPSGGGTFRSFFAFNLSSLAGKTIRSAKFLTEMTHSWDCNNTPVNLYRTADLATSGKQTWDGPNLSLWLEERSGHAHKPSGGAGCSNDPQPDLPMEFVSTNLKNDVSAYRGDSNYTLALSTRQSDGTSETTSNWWKKFDPAATKLSIEYNTNPNTPSAAQLSTHASYTAPAQACITGTDRPLVRADYPWLKATLSDPDGSNGGTLSGVFTLQKQVNSVWTTVTGWPKTDSGVAPGAKAEVQLTTKTANGDIYRWQVQTKDTLGGVSGASTWCEFSSDFSPPTAKPQVTSADGLYLASPPLGTNLNVQGSPGYSGRFTFSANDAKDVYDYVYRFVGGPEITVRAPSLGGSVTVWATPPSIGENVLLVRSRDQAGNSTEEAEYPFLVDSPAGPRAHWAIDDGTGGSLVNTVAGGPSATLVNGPTWTDGQLLGTHKSRGKDWAVKFDGTDDHATATGVAVDTTRSYSIAAWVRPDADGLMEIAGATGTATDSFMLRKWGDNRWVFTVVEQDLGTSAFTNVYGPAAVKGQWTHVAGTYDPAGGRMRLYVNGKEVASANVPQTFNPGGRITLGRERWKSTDVAYWNGAIGEVRLWDRVVDPDLDLQPLVEPVLAGRWDMEDGDSTTRLEPDLSGYQRSLALTASPTADWAYGTGYNFSTGLTVNGYPGSADTAGPVLRTDQSFTVAAWVKATKVEHQTILAQDGASRSAFYLMYDVDTSKWCITMPSVDVGTAEWQFVLSQNLAQLDTWTHVAATYDAASRELRLYVNGALQGVRANTVGWQGSSVLHVGRAKNSFFLNGGTVDQIQVWQGRLSDDRILGLMAEG
ncbi:LamG domain-containing protein, partial [Micromonospora mangrovi]